MRVVKKSKAFVAQFVRGKSVRPWRNTEDYIRRTRFPDVAYVRRAEFDRIVFICGLHRSGTTLIERRLVGLYRLAHLRAEVPESEGQHLQDVYPSARVHGGPGRFAFSPAMRPLPPDPEEAAVLRARVLSAWSNYVVGDDPVLVEKSPPNLTKIPWLRAVFPGAHFVIVARDPRAVASATRKWSSQSLEEMVFHWNVAYSIAMADFEASDCTVIRYEDFCDDPDGVLAALARDATLVPRDVPEETEARFDAVKNTNAKYLGQHAGRRYGRGVWSDLGYTL